MSWTATSGHVWVTGEQVSAASMNTYIRLNLDDLDRRTTLVTNTVATSETTASTTYAALATAGPAVAATIGASGLALVCLKAQMSGATCFMGFSVSGASTLAASDARAISTATTSLYVGAAIPVSGLTAGSNTFTALYRVPSGTGTWSARDLTVVPLGS